MKKVKINLQDLLDVLQAMQDSGGTQEVIFFEHDGLPALCDAEEPENVVTFQVYDAEMEDKDGNIKH